jgi:hypothetical protein
MMGSMQDVEGSVPDAGASAPSGIVRLDVIGTVLFTISALAAAIVFDGPFRVIGVVVALALFAIGVFAFLSGYWTAVQRSREDDIAVAQLYFFGGGTAPASVKRTMLVALAAQVVTALGTAIARSSTDGHPGSTLAFGILVPMFGLGLNGLWCARYGQFRPRLRLDSTPSDDSVPTSDDEMEQNSPHG